jgi:hypothetical protein
MIDQIEIRTQKKLYERNPSGSRNLRINWNGIKKNKNT